jgi:hypothetical protein
LRSRNDDNFTGAALAGANGAPGVALADADGAPGAAAPGASGIPTLPNERDGESPLHANFVPDGTGPRITSRAARDSAVGRVRMVTSTLPSSATT